MGSTVDILIAAVLAMAKVFIVSGIGFLCAVFPRGDPFFDVEGMQRIGRLSNFLFLPALICATIGGNLSASALLEYSPLLIADTVVRCISWTITSSCEKLLPLDLHIFKAIKIAILFPNSGSLPLLYMQSLCDHDIVNSDFSGDSSNCFATATSMIFVYLITWHLWFYTWGFYKLSIANDLDNDFYLTTAEEKCRRKDSNSMNIEDGGITEGCNAIDNCNTTDFFVGEESQMQSSPTNSSVAAKMFNIDWIFIKRQLIATFLSPPILAVIIGVALSLIEPLKDGLFHDTKSPLYPLGSAIDAVGEPLVVVQTLLMAASLAQKKENPRSEVDNIDELTRESSIRRLRKIVTICVFLICPLILVPSVGFGIFILLDKYTTVFGSNSLMRLLIILQCGMPAAQTVIVGLSHLKLPVMAATIAPLYVYQYMLSIVTVTLLATIAMRYIY